MRVLVAYASRHGATQEIAERIAETIAPDGFDVTLKHVDDVDLVERYDAFIIGSSAYIGHWEKAAAAFVRHHAQYLARRPVWLFSSGPLGTAQIDRHGRNVRDVSRPVEFAEFAGLIRPRGEEVFFGAHDPSAAPIGLAERLTAALPIARKAIPAGDFRDWPAIVAWAESVGRKLKAIPVEKGIPA